MGNKESSFEVLNSINVNEFTEKKNNLTYLSWAHALRVLQEHYPGATWDVKRFDGVPFLKTELGYFVEVGVTIEGRELTQVHPVLDYRNKPIAKPDTFNINSAIQRCLTKAISLHGLGLYIYAGEDMPESHEQALQARLATIDELIADKGVDKEKMLDFVTSKNPSIKRFSDMSLEMADKLILMLEKKESVSE